MRTLITGGTGFIGSRLALRCLSQGDMVRVLGQVNTDAENKNKQLLEAHGAQVVLASVTQREAMFDLFRDVEVVYHLAAAQHEAGVPDQYFWDINVTGTQNVLEASLQAGVKRFVHGSTIGVYGAMLKGQLDEDSPLQPDNIYGITKLEGEKLVRSWQEKLSTVVIRISETFGPGDYRLLKLFKGIKKHLFFLIGDGRNLHHLIYIDDLIDGFLLAGAAPVPSGCIFLLAGKEAVTTSEIVSTIAQQLGVSTPKIRLPLGPCRAVASLVEHTCRPLGVRPPLHRRRLDFFCKSFQFSPQRTYKQLGFQPKVNFQTGVRNTAAWYQEQGYL